MEKLFEVIYDFDDEDFGTSTLREEFYTREEALDWIENAKESPYMHDFNLVDIAEEFQWNEI